MEQITITIEFEFPKKRIYYLQEGSLEHLKSGGELIISIKHPDIAEWFLCTKIKDGKVV